MPVSPFTLGLFAPLPLAMMIPFMATQSLAMGEAFGKSFQYGKRKISSMSNEEFNKLTLAGLMEEQTADIRTLIPKLTEQMQDSNQMQETIFKEMTKLIPAFIKGLSSGTQEIITDNELSVSNLAPAPLGVTGALAGSNFDFAPLVKALTLLATTQMLGYKRTGAGQVDFTPSDIVQGPTEGPSQPPSGGILGNLDIHVNQVIKSQSDAKKLAALKTQPTEGAIRREGIATSGLSPLATRARNTFRSNIDKAVRSLDEAINMPARGLRFIYQGRSINGAQKNTAISRATAKLGALRIKYFKVYGQHY